MERKIGEIFEYNGEWYQCVGGTCRNCIFYYDTVCKNITTIGSTNFGNCHCSFRTDHKSVIFKKLEKVGKPYDFQKRTFQTYKLHTIPFLLEDVEFVAILSKDNNTIEIEIKEDMGKYRRRDAKKDIPDKGKPNLKPFNLEQAKAGKPVCTRDGRKARIICFDTKGDVCPIIALVEENGIKSAYHYDKNGKNAYKKSELDLMMFPEKKEGWVNIDKGGSGKIAVSSPYSTKEEAIHNDNETTIDTIKISWEE